MKKAAWAIKADAPTFDDEYVGPRWTYGLQWRPITGAGVPKGFIIFSDRPHPDFRHGTVDYPQQLTDREVEQMELVETQRVETT